MSKQQKKKRKLAQRKKVQARFKKRVSEGKSGLTGGQKGSGPAGSPGSTISIYRQKQLDQVRDAATIRNLDRNLDTNALVARDNRMYGNTVPEGSFSISAAGRRQAAANKEAARKEAIRKSKFDPSRLSSSFNQDFSGFANNAARGFSTLSIADRLAPKGGLSSYYMSGNRPKMSFMDAYNLEKGMQQQTGKFDPNRKFNLASYARGESNPFRGMPGYGTVKSLVNPRIRNINYNRMLQGKPPLSMDKINPGGFQTAPTEFTRRVLPGVAAFLPGYNIGSKLFNLGQTDSSLDKSLKNVDNVNVGGLSIGFNSPESTDVGARLGKFFTSVPGKVANLFSGEANAADKTAGGLNIGGSDSGEATGRSLTSRALGAIDAVVGTDLDKLGGRTTPFGERLTSSIDSFGTLKKNMSDLGINMGGDLSIQGLQNAAKNISTTGKKLSMEDLAATSSFAKTFKDKPLDAVANLNPDGSKRVIKTLQTLDKNKDVSEALANYGGKGFQKGLRDTASLVSDNYDKLSTDAKGNRKVVSNMLMGNDPRSEFAKRLAFQQKENPQLSLQSKIKYASDPNFKQFTGKGFENKIKGINKKEMGLTGSVGNLILSNQGRDIVTGNVPGTNNALDLASNIINTGRDPSSSTYNASQNFLRTIGAGGQPTPGSIIRGVNPFRRIGRSTGQQTQRGGSGTATPVGRLPQVTNPAEVELPIIPQQQQQGTNNTTLAGIQNQSYQNTFNNLMAQFRPRNINRRRTFRTSFNRDYFSQFV